MLNRYGYLLIAAGLVVLAACCWTGGMTEFSMPWSGGLSDWSIAAPAYAAPPSRGTVVRRAAPDDDFDDDDIPVVVASDRTARAASRTDSLRDAVLSAQAARQAAQREAPQRHAADDEGDELPDDEPAELVAARPLPQRTPASNQGFASRRRGAEQPTPAHDPSDAIDSFDEAQLGGRRSRVEKPQGAPVSGTPTLADPALDPDRDTSAAAIDRDYRPVQRGSSDLKTFDDDEPLPALPNLDATPRAAESATAPRELPAIDPARPQAATVELDDSPFGNRRPAPTNPANDRPPHRPVDASRPRYEPVAAPAGAPGRFGPAYEADVGSAAHDASAAQRSVMLRWETPSEIQLDVEAECRLLVQNDTDATLSQVLVEAHLPAGLRLTRAEPAQIDAQGRLTWSLAKLAPRALETIRLWVVPTGEGEVEPTATVTFSHATAARLNVIHPQLELEAVGPASSLAGQPAGLRLVVSNPGTGKARNVVIEVGLDRRLQSSTGGELRYAIGSLAGGESREVQVALNPTEAGQYEIHATAKAEPGLVEETQYLLEVVKPALQVAVDGPRLRYVDRQATYSIRVHNPGPSPADNVQVIDDVPSGFRFVDASSGGTFDAEARQVAWFVGRLEPHETTEVQVQLIATEPGEQRISAAVRADAGVSEIAETVTRIEGLAAVVLEVVDADDPIEVSGETSYEIRLTNRGSQAARGVQAAAKLPPELEALDFDGPTAGRIQGQQVVFEPLESLAPGQTQVYTVRVLCRGDGHVTFRAYYRDADHPNPMVVEELTRVYQD